MVSKSSKTKKRTKKYTGVNAKQANNIIRVRRVNAVVRSNFGQWLHEHQKLIRNIAIVILILILIFAGFAALFR